MKKKAKAGRARPFPPKGGAQGLGVLNAVCDKKGREMVLLSIQNAHIVSTIRNVDFPEWGILRFNYRSDIGAEGEPLHSFGVWVNSALLAEYNFCLWEVISWK